MIHRNKARSKPRPWMLLLEIRARKNISKLKIHKITFLIILSLFLKVKTIHPKSIVPNILIFRPTNLRILRPNKLTYIIYILMYIWTLYNLDKKTSPGTKSTVRKKNNSKWSMDLSKFKTKTDDLSLDQLEFLFVFRFLFLYQFSVEQPQHHYQKIWSLVSLSPISWWYYSSLVE